MMRPFKATLRFLWRLFQAITEPILICLFLALFFVYLATQEDPSD